MKVLSGKSLNHLIVNGNAFLFARRKSKVNCIHIKNPAVEKARFEKAQQIALSQLKYCVTLPCLKSENSLQKYLKYT